MPEDNTLAITADQFQSLSTDAQSTLRTQLQSAGYTAEQLAKLIGTPAAAAQTNGGTATAPTPMPASPTSAAHIPAGQKITAFKNLRAVGVDDAALQKAAAEEGIAWSDIAKDAAPAPQSIGLDEANQKLADTTGPLAAGTAPSDYSFKFDPAHIAGLDAAEVADINNMFANGFHEAGVPLSASQSVFRALMDTAVKFADMPDGPERTLAFRTEGARLQRLGNADQIKADAEYAYGKMPAAFRAVIDEQFMMHSAEGYQAMARTGQMIRAREGKKG